MDNYRVPYLLCYRFYMTSQREERSEKVMTLAHLLELKEKSKYPTQYDGAIKRIKWEILGMYRAAMNERIPVDKPIETSLVVV